MTEGFLILYFLSFSFYQKWYFPQGVAGFGNTIMQILDTDRDGNLEFAFTTYGSWPAYIHFYELHLPNTWERDSILLPGGDLLWDSGDFDTDGLYDLALQFHIENPTLADGIMIFESPDSFSYPTQEVWRDTVGFALVQPISAYDVDKDGFPEIFKLGWKKEDSTTIYYPFGVYESTGDNAYDTIFMAPTALGSLCSTIAFGDFDSDSFDEFIIGNIDGYYQLWECIANNNYQLLQQQQLPTANIKDCFSVLDADGDGKMEFVVKGFTVPDARIHTFIFEATGDNTYQIIKSFNFFGGYEWYGGGYSEAGDVDGDSIPEIVLEGCQNVHIIKSADNDSFYLWDTLPGNAGGSSIRVTNDIDGNGLNEIVISGGNETRIYEYDPGGVEEEARNKKSEARLILTPNPFAHTLSIRYQTPLGDRISLKVYDVTGRLVKQFTPLNSKHSAGFNHLTDYQSLITWFGNDESGRSVPQGIYFIRLENHDSGDNICKKVLKVK